MKKEKLNECCKVIKEKYDKLTTKQKIATVGVAGLITGLVIGLTIRRK